MYADDLAHAIMLFDEENPGDPEATVEVPYETWAHWINLAGNVEEERLRREEECTS